VIPALIPLALKAGGWLLGRPSVLVAIGAGVALAVTVGTYQVKLWSVRGDLAQAEIRLGEAMQAGARLGMQLGEMTGNRDRLAAAIEVQNAAIENMRHAADAAGKAAALSAVRSLQQAEARKRASDALTGSGPQVMNQWLRDTFGPR